MQQQAHEDELGLSSAALAALKEFALENDMIGGEDDADIRLQVQERMDVKERDHDFKFIFGHEGDDQQVTISLTGVNPELGQTLASTGLTIWRAAEEMARFMWEHRQWFVGKRVVELGAGLGLCGVLASKLCTGGQVVITDGGDEFTDLAMEALRQNLEKNSCKLAGTPGVARIQQRNVRKQGPDEVDDRVHENTSAVSGEGESRVFDSVIQADASDEAEVFLERLTWGEHEGFLESIRSGHGEGEEGGEETKSGDKGFDYIIAADVIYEEEAVIPLLRTVVDILKLRRSTDCRRRDGSRSTTSSPRSSSSPERASPSSIDRTSLAPPPVTSTCLLAFARRNVSIERVLAEAERIGLQWRVPDADTFVPSSTSENIYLMCLTEDD